MFKSIILWALKVPTLLFLDLFTIVFSPIICLFVTHEEESEATGFPSLFPGKPREFLIKPLRIFQSFDAPLDEWWYGDYALDSWRKNYTQADYDSKWWIRYLSRIMWLCRNSAYGFGLALGYDSNDMMYLVEKDNDALWKTNNNMVSFWKVENPKGEIGWWYKAQWFYTKERCIMINIGYKLDADSPNGKKVVAMQFNPFKSYPLK